MKMQKSIIFIKKMKNKHLKEIECIKVRDHRHRKR